MLKPFIFSFTFLVIAQTVYPLSIKAQSMVQFQVGQPSGSVTNGSFQGFGAEWDPFFWNTNNQNRGLTQSDWDIITNRIKELKPGIVRVMMQLYWATNDPNLKSWTWNTPQMQSVFKYLDFLKANDIDVVLTDWGWAVRSDTNFYSGPTDDRFAQGVAAYMDEFINKRGYTNIKYLVIGNEPDNEIKKDFGQAAYETMYRNVHSAIDANGIGDKVKLTGPDMGGDWDFMKTSINGLSNILDTYDFHRYASMDETANNALPGIWESLWSHLELWRTETLTRDSGSANKLILLTEMGNSGGGTNTHPQIDTFEYALHMADYGTTVLTTRINAGIAWCMHDMYYFDGGQFMQWGMWKYKNDNWAIRPWAQTFGLLIKFAPRGSLIAAINGVPPQTPALSPYRMAALKRPDGGWSMFLVNRTGSNIQFAVSLPQIPSKALNTYHINSSTLNNYPNNILAPPDGVLSPSSSFSVSVPANSFLVLAEPLVGAIPVPTSPVSSPTFVPSPTNQIGKSGDANGDGKVDGLDYVVWLNHYNPNVSQSGGASIGNFNNSVDNYVDGLDYVIWMNNYGS